MKSMKRALHTALYARLATTLGYTAYARAVPQSPVFPCVVLAEVVEVRDQASSDKDSDGARCRAAVRVDARDPLAAMDAAKAIVDHVTQSPLSVDGFYLIGRTEAETTTLTYRDAALGDIHSENIDFVFVAVSVT